MRVTLLAVLLAFACGTLRAEGRVNLNETVEAYPVLESIRLVRFGQPYWMGTCEISNAQFQRFDPDHFSRYYVKRHETRGDDRGMPLDQPDQPALRVSWNRAMAFCKWLSEKTGLNVSLPTEEQWETACRAGSGRAFHYRGEGFSE